ncbi:MAG: hypothetical protein HOQ02_09450, partial [Lysobacter sp.]|nr:hypothetical protein [Lysobacter sp.]
MSCSSFPRRRQSSGVPSSRSVPSTKSLDPRLRRDDGKGKHALRAFGWLALLSLLFFASDAFAQAAPAAATPALPSVNVGQIGGAPVSMPLQVLLLMTGITLLPAALLGVTAFTRIIIVLGLLRQALGTGQTPSNQILLALALFLTFMVMTPVFDQAWAHGIAPYLDHTMDFKSAWAAASQPFRAFMLAQVRTSDLMTFAGLSNTGPYATPQDVPFGVLAASFLTSELKTAFEIAFLIYIPFVIIDLVVA